MKITDIINEAETKVMQKIGSIPVIKVKQLPSPNKRGDKLSFFDSGVQSIAAEHATNDGIIKYTTLSGPKDPALEFVNTAMFNSDNPWLPTYSTAKIYFDGSDYLLISVAEKLKGDLHSGSALGSGNKYDNFFINIPRSAVGKGEEEAYVNEVLMENWEVESVEELRTKEEEHPDAYKETLMDAKVAWAGRLFYMAKGANLTKIKTFFDDENLHKAVDIISQYHQYHMDMHVGNYMWRGDQLVFNDPLVDRSDMVDMAKASEETDKK